MKTEEEKKDFVFRDITLDSRELIESYTKPWELDCSDTPFGNLFIWGADGKMQYAVKNHALYIKLDFEGVPVFLWAPIPMKGSGTDYRKAVLDGIAYMRSIGTEPTFRSVWTPFKDMMLEACPELFSMPTDIAWDYIYERESLATLKGKKLHGKRNHINKFLANHPDYVYKTIDRTMIGDCKKMYEKWFGEKEEMQAELADETRSVMLALNNMETLGLTGGAIYLDGEMCAFTIGERILPNTELIHIEKADAQIEGLFPMINQQYVIHECEGVEFINREEDMGVEGMRKAKRSYRPVRMVEKYMIGTRDLTEVKGLWGEKDD